MTPSPPPRFYKLYKKKNKCFYSWESLSSVVAEVKIDRFFSFFLRKGIVQKLGPAIISITNVPTHSPHSLLKHLCNIFLLKKSESELSE